MYLNIYYVGARLRKAKNKRVICLQSQCTNNQQLFKNSEEAEFFAAFYLVFSIFFRNFKIAGWESSKAKTYITLKYGYIGGPAQQGKSMLAGSMHWQPAIF